MKSNAGKLWCLSSDKHVHGDDKKCVNDRRIFHAVTSSDDANIPAGYCALRAENSAYPTCSYIRLKGDKMEVGPDSSPADSAYHLRAIQVAAGVVSIKVGNIYLQQESNSHHIKKLGQCKNCGERCMFVIEEKNTPDQCGANVGKYKL